MWCGPLWPRSPRDGAGQRVLDIAAGFFSPAQPNPAGALVRAPAEALTEALTEALIEALIEATIGAPTRTRSVRVRA